MSQAMLVRLAFKPNGKESWLQWTEELKARHDEVLQTLADEGVRTEACFMSEHTGEVFYYMEADDLETAKKIAAESIHKIDQQHREVWRNSLDMVEKLECLFLFQDKPKANY